MNLKSIERRFDILRTAVSMLIALVLAFLVIMMISKDPLSAIRTFLTGPFTRFRYFSDVIVMMIPIMFTALAICVVYQAAQYNLIADGVFYLCGALSAWIAINSSLHPLIIMLLVGAIGALIAVIPGLMKVRWGANEVVSSIMMNYVLILFGVWLLMYKMKDMAAGYNASYIIPEKSRLTNLIPGTRIHSGLIIAAVLIVLVYLFLYKSKWGYEIRMTGENSTFASYSGIKTTKVIVYASMISGLLAGMGGASEILGIYQRFQWERSMGYGWDGMMVAILARKNPALVPLAAFFLAYLRIGADLVNRTSDVPVEFISIVQGTIIVFVAAEQFMSAMRHRAITKASQKNLQEKEAKS